MDSSSLKARMSRYLSATRFAKLYTKVRASQIKTHESVVETSECHAIKAASLDWILSDICLLLQTSSDYVIPLIHYTIELNPGSRLLGRYSMPLGVPIVQLNLDELLLCVHDLLESCMFLASNGLIHADIKPENIVYLPAVNRYILIDLGLTRRTIFTSEGQKIQGIAYTLPFRDYQFYGDLNPVSCEVFALGQTIRCLALGSNCIYDNSPCGSNFKAHLEQRYPQANANRIASLVNFVESCLSDPESRPTLEELAENFNCNRIGDLKQHQLEIAFGRFNVSDLEWYSMISWLCFDFAEAGVIPIQAIYLMLTNLHRCRQLVNSSNLNIIAMLNLYLATVVLKSTVVLNYEQLQINSTTSMSVVDVINWLPQILETLGGRILVPTLWDSANSLREVCVTLASLLAPSYEQSAQPIHQARHLLTDMQTFCAQLQTANRIVSYLDVYAWVNSKTLLLRQPSPLASSSASLRFLEPLSKRRQIEKHLKSHGVSSTLNEFFNPEEEVGFFYLYQDLLETHFELLYQAIERIRRVSVDRKQRYNAVFRPNLLLEYEKQPSSRRRDWLSRQRVFI